MFCTKRLRRFCLYKRLGESVLGGLLKARYFYKFASIMSNKICILGVCVTGLYLIRLEEGDIVFVTEEKTRGPIRLLFLAHCLLIPPINQFTLPYILTLFTLLPYIFSSTKTPLNPISFFKFFKLSLHY